MTRFIKYLMFFIFASIILMILFSPYGMNDNQKEKVIRETILIDADISVVYTYLGNSNNAKDWSVYINHITPQNIVEFDDGKKGSIRRCFKNENETGIFWDEKILIEELNKRRRLNIYNMHGFSLSGNGLLTEQLYTGKEGKTELTLSLFLDEKQGGYIKDLKLYFAGYKVSTIFKDNLEQIKTLIETQIK